MSNYLKSLCLDPRWRLVMLTVCFAGMALAGDEQKIAPTDKPVPHSNNQKAEVKLSEAKARIKELEKSLDLAQGTEKKLRKAEGDLREELAQTTKLRDETHTRWQAAVKERDELKSRAADFEKRLAETETSARKKAEQAEATLKQAQADAAREADRARENFSGIEKDLRKQLAGKSDRAAALEKEKNAADVRIADLEKSLTAANATEKQIRNAENVLRKQLDEAKSQQNKFQQDLSSVNRERDDLQSRLADITKKTSTLEKELASRRERITELDRQLAGSSGKVRELEAALANQTKRYEQEGLIRQGRALREQIDDATDPALVWSLNDAGLLYLNDGRLDQAEEMFRRALVILDNTTGRANPSAGTLLQHLADTVWQKNNLIEAGSLYREAANTFASSLGQQHPRYAAALNGWASVLVAQQNYTDAETYYRQALDIYGRSSRGPAIDMAIPAHNLGLMLLNQGRVQEAGPFLERAARIVESEGDRAGTRGVIIFRSMLRYCQALGDVERAARYEQKVNDLAVAAMLP